MKARDKSYYDEMIAEYNIEYKIYTRKGNDFFEAYTAYLPDIIEFGNSKQESLELICDSIETTKSFWYDKFIHRSEKK
jgi:hypothetical protein